MSITEETLDCGHPASPHMSCTTGYGIDPATGKKYCFECCAARDKLCMRDNGRIDCYLSSDGCKAVNWPGIELATVTSKRFVELRGFGRTYKAVYVRAIESNGTRWHGRGMGLGMILRMKRCK